ncbi:unnamed protein product, partial [Rotaria socialis]
MMLTLPFQQWIIGEKKFNLNIEINVMGALVGMATLIIPNGTSIDRIHLAAPNDVSINIGSFTQGTSVDRARRSESTQLGYGVSTRYWANRLMGCKDG